MRRTSRVGAPLASCRRRRPIPAGSTCSPRATFLPGPLLPEKNSPVTAVEGVEVAASTGQASHARGDRCGGDRREGGGVGEVEHVAKHWARVAVELAEAAAEIGGGDQSAPSLADRSASEQQLRLVRGKTQQHLLLDVVVEDTLPSTGGARQNL